MAHNDSEEKILIRRCIYSPIIAVCPEPATMSRLAPRAFISGTMRKAKIKISFGAERRVRGGRRGGNLANFICMYNHVYFYLMTQYV